MVELKSSSPLRPMLLAGALVILLAGGAAMLWQQGQDATNPLTKAERSALDELGSGEVRGLDDGTQLSMIASFRAAEGQLCREYQLVKGDVFRAVLACRERHGWQQRFATITPTKAGTFESISEESAMGAAIEAIGAGAPLNSAEENSALGSQADRAPPN